MLNINQESVSIRLSKLEALNRKLRRSNLLNFALLFTLIAISGLQYTGWDFTQGKVVSAEKFVLKDSRGNIRAELRSNSTGTIFALFDVNGVPRASMAVADGEPGFHLYNEIGFRQVAVGISKNGPSLTFMKPSGLKYAGITFLNNGDLGYYHGQGNESNQPTRLYTYCSNEINYQENLF